MTATSTFQFLNINSGAIQAVSTLALVLITLYYAWQTREAVREAANTRKDYRLPLVKPIEIRGPILSRTREDKIETRLELNIQNIGYGLALNICVMFPNQEPMVLGNLPEEEETWFKILLGDDEVQKLKDLPKPDKTIYLKYEDIFGRKIGTTILFDVKTLGDSSKSWLNFYLDKWLPDIPK